jgi:HEAT repeat protein
MDRGFHRIRRMAHADPHNPETQLRLAAARLRQGHEPVPEAGSCWHKHLEELEAKQRFQAIIELSKLGPAAAGLAPVLIDTVQERLESEFHDRQEQTSRRFLEAVLSTFEELGPATAPALIAALSSHLNELRYVAIQALAKISKENAKRLGDNLGAFMTCLEDRDPRIRYKAAEQLRLQGPGAKVAIPALCHCVQDPDRNVRIMSLLALRKIGPYEDCLPVLLRSLKDREPLVRFWSARILGDMEELAEGSRKSLYYSLIDDEDKVRKAAAEALNKINNALKRSLAT